MMPIDDVTMYIDTTGMCVDTTGMCVDTTGMPVTMSIDTYATHAETPMQRCL